MYPLFTGVKQFVINFIAYWPPTAPAIEFMLIIVFPSDRQIYSLYLWSIESSRPYCCFRDDEIAFTWRRSAGVGLRPSVYSNILYALSARRIFLHSGAYHCRLGLSIFSNYFLYYPRCMIPNAYRFSMKLDISSRLRRHSPKSSCRYCWIRAISS